MSLIAPMPRDRRDEVMDDPGLDADAHRLALRGLTRINRWSRTLDQIEAEIVRLRGDQPTRILELACGGGDVARGLARRAARRGRPWTVHGSDVSPRAIELATQRAAELPGNRDSQASGGEASGAGGGGGGGGCEFFTLDALADPLPPGYDLVLNTLFLHHLDAPAVVALLGKMAAASPCVLVSDLVRSRRALAFTHVGVRVLSRSPVVHVDGPLSIHGAWTQSEMSAMAREAGLAGAAVRRAFPFRMMLSWQRGMERRRE